MFTLRSFIRGGFLAAVGRLADYQILLNAAGWYDKGVLLTEDLAEIQAALDAHRAAIPAPPVTDPSAEDPAAPA